jgi:hypothetical protein
MPEALSEPDRLQCLGGPFAPLLGLDAEGDEGGLDVLLCGEGGMRLKDWNTKPMFSLRTFVSRVPESLAKSVPPRTTSPAAGRSRPPSI